MCCVGTKNLLADYRYIVDRFVELDALEAQRAVSFATLGFDFSEHLFARDNFQSLLRCGDIVRCEGGYYLAHRREGLRPQNFLEKLFGSCPTAGKPQNCAL